MAPIKACLLVIGSLICILIQCKQVQSGWIKDSVSHLAGKLVTDVSKVFQDPLTRTLCPLKTVCYVYLNSFVYFHGISLRKISNRMS